MMKNKTSAALVLEAASEESARMLCDALPAISRSIRSIQLTQNFYFGSKKYDRLHSDGNKCKLTLHSDHIAVEINSFDSRLPHTYRVPLDMCIVEYV